ncbi:hypothetical protein V8E52_002833 [Russula decolorans]
MQPSFPYDGPGPWRQSAPLSSALKVLMGSPLDWAQNALARIESEDDIGMFSQLRAAPYDSHTDIAASDSREVATNIWTVLKTLLFTTIML